jgi:hypothetical protein
VQRHFCIFTGSLPYTHTPWRLRGTPFLDHVERKMQNLPLTTPGWGPLIKRELLKQTRSMDSMQEGLVYKAADNQEFPIVRPIMKKASSLKKTKGQIHARDVNNLVVPFQCDLCHFRNLTERDPQGNRAQDIRILKCIRRANLDPFWASEPRTVQITLAECKCGV